ncbi:hypothetical protein LCGC14_0731740 [marine sediment metagenome]|uniref:Putative DnaT-like domain-containing protein n=1 Tax=marine sediment metagenome TaxID=412755 RepID=A0A0F9QUD1_9ZZZZ
MATGLTELSDLIVEDGTIVAGANSFTDIATVNDYANLRQTGPFLAWIDADESNRVAALIIATDYLCRRWDWRGIISDEVTPQDLCFPRFIDGGTLFDSDGVDVTDTVPDKVIECQILYAVRAIDALTNEAVALMFDTNPQEEDGRIVSRKMEELGPLKEETRYFGSGSRPTTVKWRNYGAADECVRDSGLAAPGGAGDTVIRA